MRKFLVMLLACFFLLVPATAPATAPITARIDILGGIDETTPMSVQAQLDEAKKAGAQRLDIHINSPGGSIVAGLDTIRIIRASDIPTVCIVDGVAVSMAAIILESNACGERVVTPASLVMFHGAQGQAQGDQGAISRAAVVSAAFNKMVAGLIAPRMGMTPEEFYQRFGVRGEELWLVGEEAVRAHAADRLMPLPGPARG